jgi:hypothetical protein
MDVNGNERYKRDYENIINAYQAINDYFIAYPKAAKVPRFLTIT